MCLLGAVETDPLLCGNRRIRPLIFNSLHPIAKNIMALPRSRSYHAALNALVRVADEESRNLCSVIESPLSTDSEREQALKDLSALCKSMVLRVAELQKVSLATEKDLAESSEDAQAA